MNNLNHVLLDGVLTRDPEIKTLASTSSSLVCRFTIAVNRYYKKRKDDKTFEQEASFFWVEAWGDLARQSAEILKKGLRIRVVGRLRQSKWNEGGDETKPRERISVVAEHIEYSFPPKKVRENEEAEEEHSIVLPDPEEALEEL